MSFKPTNPKSQFLNNAIKKFALAIMKHQGEPHFRTLQDGSADFDIDQFEMTVRELKDILMENPFVKEKPKFELSNYLVDMICEEDIIADTKMANKLEKIYKSHKEKGWA